MTTPQVSLTDLDRLFQQVKNWDRWGPDDQRGALNYITAEARRAAASLVQEGAVVSAARSLATAPAPDNLRPVQHMMVRAGDVQEGQLTGGSSDYFAIAPHGFANTHIDALCHIFYRGQMYGGRPISAVTSQGALANAITAGADGLVSRGVLLDIPRLRGVDWLEPGSGISRRELEQAEAAAGLRVQQGDIVLVYTGRWRRRAARGPWAILPGEGLAGLDLDCMVLLHERQIAVLGCDGVSDVSPSPVAEVSSPIHVLALVAMGVHLLDNCDLEALATACAARGRWAFQLVVAPLRLERGTGSPVNPIAIF